VRKQSPLPRPWSFRKMSSSKGSLTPTTLLRTPLPPETAELRWKAVFSLLNCVANNIFLLLLYKSPDVCIFARFKANYEVVPLRSFANFKLIISSHRKELCGDPKARGPRPWPMRKSVTGYNLKTTTKRLQSSSCRKKY